MGGPRLTPEQLAKAAEVYAATENYSDAARAIGRAVTTVQEALLRLSTVKNRKLHARAVERGLRRGRRAMARQVARMETLLVRWVDAPLGLVDGRAVGGVLGPDDRETAVEPRDVGTIAAALATAHAALETAAANIERRLLAKLTRARTRAETARALVDTEVARAKLAAGAGVGDEAAAALLDGVREFLATRPPKPGV